MSELFHQHPAFGGPGIEPRWTRSDKDGVGTAYSASSLVWFTVSAGILNEVYFPTIDRPQIRDLQYMVTDGETFCHDERRHTNTKTERLCDDSLGYRVVNEDDGGRYRIEKVFIAAPHSPCVLIRTRLVPSKEWRGRLKLYVLVAPHLNGHGCHNTAQLARQNDHEFLVAEADHHWLALGATLPFGAASCGYVGASDGWQDLHDDRELDWSFDIAAEGNVAMIAEIPQAEEEFTLGIAFAFHLHGAITELAQSLAIPFEAQQEKFSQQWSRACRNMRELGDASQDDGRLYRVSHSLLLGHEDKTYHGAMIASLSIPWGEVKGEDDLGGYHLVWTRDLVQSATGLLASGNTETPFRALVYMACSQQSDGGFSQNFWVDGEPYWSGIQLDEVAMPVILAWRLAEADALRDFDPWPMVKAAAGYLVRHGPATPQERWEENSGYSPSTLASNIAALTCAAMFAKKYGDDDLARYLHEYADFLEAHVDEWTVTTEGSLVDGISRHFIRLHPVDIKDPTPNENPNEGMLRILNRDPDKKSEFPAKDIVDAGFLELVRFGIRAAGDSLFEDSLRVVDATLKVDTPGGPCWRRYNHDGYGQRPDGGPFESWGRGRAWPLLTGERGHYEFAAGRDVKPYLKAIEAFANSTGLLPEQIWDEPDLPDARMYFGRPTGSAMPLMWAHSEYIRLLRSVQDGSVFDRVEGVANRYQGSPRRRNKALEIWKFNRQIARMPRDRNLRIQAHVPFRLRFSTDGWTSLTDCDSTHVAIDIHYCDLTSDKFGPGPVEFTFFWTNANHWEGRNYQISFE